MMYVQIEYFSLLFTELTLSRLIYQLVPMQSFEQFWALRPFSLKFYAVTSIAIFLATLACPNLSRYFIDDNAAVAMNSMDIPQYSYYYNTQYNFQALFFSFYGMPPDVLNTINVVFQILWLCALLKDHKSGTLYKLIEVILINFQVNVIYSLFVCALACVPSALELPIVYPQPAYGWASVLIVYEFRQARRNPDEEKRFCCMPFTIKSKHFAWFIAFIFALFTQQVVFIVAATFVGCLQELMVGHMIIRLPFCFYKSIEWCLPNFIKSRYDYVAISDMAEKKLKKRSLRLCPKRKRFTGSEVRVGGENIVNVIIESQITENQSKQSQERMNEKSMKEDEIPARGRKMRRMVQSDDVQNSNVGFQEGNLSYSQGEKGEEHK